MALPYSTVPLSLLLTCHLLLHWFSQSLLIACQIPSFCFCNDSYICSLQLLLPPSSLSPFLHFFLPILIHYCPINDSETIFSQSPKKALVFQMIIFLCPYAIYSLNCAPRCLFHTSTLLFNSQNSYPYIFFLC